MTSFTESTITADPAPAAISTYYRANYAGSGNFTLPSIGLSAGNWVFVKQEATNTLTVVGTVDGVAGSFLLTQYQSYWFIWNGTSWDAAMSYSPAGAIPLNTLGAPTGSVNLNSEKIVNLLPGAANTDAANVEQLPSTTTVSSTGTFTPTITGTYEVTLVGGGGGGGGGGTPSGSALTDQMGGLGGSQGESKTQLISLTAASVYNIIIGAAGSGGAGGAAAGHTGTNGSPGGPTLFSSGQSTTFNGTNNTALSSLGTLAVVSNAGMPSSGSGLIQVTSGTGSLNSVQQFSYTGLGTNTLTGCTYVGQQSSTVQTGNFVLVGSTQMISAPGAGGQGGTTNVTAVTIGAASGYAMGFTELAASVGYGAGPGSGGGYFNQNLVMPAGGAVGKGAGGGQAGEPAGGGNGGTGGFPGSFTYAQQILPAGGNSSASGGNAPNALSTDWGAGGGGGGGTRAITVSVGGNGGNGGPGVAIIVGPLV